MRVLRWRWIIPLVLLTLVLALGGAAGVVWLNRMHLAEDYLREGRALAEQGQTRSALGDFTLAILLAPEQPHVYAARAEAYEALHMPAEAVVDLDAAIARDPRHPGLRYRRALLLGTPLQRYRDAIVDFDAVLELTPDNAEAWYRRGLAYDQINNSHHAVKDFSRALELEPRLFDAWLQRAHAYRRFRDHRAEAADLTAALRLQPGATGLYRVRAEAWIALNEFDLALRDLNRVLAAAPSASMFYKRGTVHMQMGLPRDAVQDYTRAVELNPGAAVAYYNRALAYRALGQPRLARRDFAIVCELMPYGENEACQLAHGD